MFNSFIVMKNPKNVPLFILKTTLHEKPYFSSPETS